MSQHRDARLPGALRSLVLLGALGSLGLSVVVPAAPAQAETVNVSVAGLAFDPPAVAVKLTGGEQGVDAAHAHVIWTMADPGTQHTITFDDPRLVSSEPLTGGQRHEVVLYAPGTVTYRCTIHPAMMGSLVVTPGPPEAAPPASAPVRSPDAVDPATVTGNSGHSAAIVVIGLSVLASAAVLAWYLLRGRRPRIARGGAESGGDSSGR